MPRQHLEIHDLDQFDRHIGRTDSLTGWFLQSVDLTRRGAELAAVDPEGAVFLGCSLTDSDQVRLIGRGALVFPELPGLPFNPYRGGLYTAAELFSDAHYDHSLDALVYAWFRGHGTRPSLSQTLAMSLHDHSISDALDEVELDPTKVVGVMGGHAMLRTDPAYAEAARFARSLSRRGRYVLTGGGPGAMEAANLGAYLSGFDDDALDEALWILRRAPSFRPSIDAWASAALAVRETFDAERAGESLGIPTWFYGHEPPNAFATQIAKYFANALREDTLLHRCRGGIVYLRGAAGTVQEVFQAVTGNYYAADAEVISPMVLVGRDHWTNGLPAWPLLEALADGRPMADHVHLVDSLDEALSVLN